MVLHRIAMGRSESVVGRANYMPPILVTGAAGFIGFHMAARFLADGRRVVGFDNVNDYYDVSLKQARLSILSEHRTFEFIQADLADAAAVEEVFAKQGFEIVIHLAAQAGVRY